MIAEATTERQPELPPPRTRVGVVNWLRQNLFSTWYNALLSVLALYIVYLIVPPLIQWAFIDSYLSGDTREACVDREGACWVFIKVWFWQFVYGRYPIDERWRIDVAFIILILAAIPLFIRRFKWKGWIGVFLLVGYPVIAFFLFTGGTVTFNLAKWVPFILLIAAMVPIFMSRFRIKPWLGGYRRIYYAGFCVVLAAWIIFGRLELNLSFQAWNEVETRLWGGLFLTLVIAGVGIVMSLPIGVVLALGRRSNMPAVRAVCVAFIELWRGVPLITVLFMASVMFPLFMPEGMTFDKLLRALIGIMLFWSAYMAEVVRGGLQAIPKGQYEGAQAVGLSYWKMMASLSCRRRFASSYPASSTPSLRCSRTPRWCSSSGSSTSSTWFRRRPRTRIGLASIMRGTCSRRSASGSSASACRAIASASRRSFTPATSLRSEPQK